MPDPATHIIIPLIGVRIIEIWKRRSLICTHNRYLFALGCIFPDILDKALPYTVLYCHRLAKYFDIIDTKYFFGPTMGYLHTPLMLIICCYAFCLLFKSEFRPKAFIMLFAGSSIHMIFDLLQGNICDVGYFWFFPFSFEAPGFVNLFYEDRTVPWVPLFIAVYVVLEIIMRYVSAGSRRHGV